MQRIKLLSPAGPKPQSPRTVPGGLSQLIGLLVQLLFQSAVQPKCSSECALNTLKALKSIADKCNKLPQTFLCFCNCSLIVVMASSPQEDILIPT